MQKWRLDGQAVRTLDDARGFLESVGFCLMYPMRPAYYYDVRWRVGWS